MVDKLMFVLERILKWIVISIMVVLICIVFFQVFSRTVFGKSYVAIEELSNVLLAWVAFTSIAYTTRKRTHVSIEFFTQKLSVKVRKSVELLVELALLIVIAVLVKNGYALAAKKVIEPMMVLPIPTAVMYSSFPAGMALCFLCMAGNLYDTAKELMAK